jgi:hypothetical protein
MIKTSVAPIESKNLVSSSSRYIGSTVLYYGNQNFVTFETYKRKNYVKSGIEKVMVISKGVEYRPDLVSYDFYGFADVWWKILEANGMSDIFEFKAGVTIILPESI